MKQNEIKNSNIDLFFMDPYIGVKFILIDFYPIYLIKRREFPDHENGMMLRKKVKEYNWSNSL